MQYNYTTKRAKGKHLNLIEKGKIEALLKTGYSKRAIAKEIGVSERTIYRELKKGRVEQLKSDLTYVETYSAEYSHIRYRKNQKRKEGFLKIGSHIKLATYIEKLIIEEKYSPYAALEKAKAIYDVNFCVKTLYNYIHKRVFYQLSEKHLPYKKRYSKQRDKDKRIRKIGGHSIEERSSIINERLELGHWEIDTVVGKRGSKSCLLVLTERLSRKELIYKLENKSVESVVEVLYKLKKRYKKTFNQRFKSITSDNGSEFMNAKAFEDLGIEYFYAHSYNSSERGSNENNNRLIRRFIPKSVDIGIYTESYIRKVERFMNDYPRKIFDGQSANMVYDRLFKYDT